MNNYKNFYFLHIPKTGGRYAKEYILSQLEDTLKTLPITDRHEGWVEVNDDTYIFSILREPVQFACSLYAHEVMQKAGLMENVLINSKEYIDRNISNVYLDKKYLIAYYMANPWARNLQSKHIVNGRTDSKKITDVIIQKYTFTDKVDKDLLYERLNRINLLVRQTSLYSPKPVAKKLCDDLDIKMAGEIENDNLIFHNIASSNLYNSLTEEDKKWLEDFFAIDVEIYNNHSIFSQLDNVCSFCGDYAYTTEFDTTWKKYSFCVECIKSKEAFLG